jgi:hypothetical protein
MQTGRKEASYAQVDTAEGRGNAMTIVSGSDGGNVTDVPSST